MLQPLKVVHFAPAWLPITQTWLYNQVRCLPATVESHIVCRSARNLGQFQVPNIHALKQESVGHYLAYKIRFAFGGRDQFPYFDDQLARIRPEVVHSHFGNNGWTVRKAVRKAGVRHVVTFYGQDMSRLPQSQPVWVQRYHDLFADPETRFLCEGEAMKQSLVRLGCAPEKLTTHHLGVKVGEIPFAPRQWDRKEPFRVLIAAGFREKKGIPYALDALARIRKEIPLQITLIGDAEPTAASRREKQVILDRIQKHGLGPVTRLLGYQPFATLRRESGEHHLFLATSVTAGDGDTEGGAPVAIIDAAASGMPVVSSFHCDIPDVIRQGETGWLAQERDVDGIVAAIRNWLNASPGQWQQFLLAGRRHVEREYDADIQGQKLASLYAS